MNTKIDVATVDEVREILRSALAAADAAHLREALTAGLQLLDELCEAMPAGRASSHAGSLVYTFEDEDYEPNGRRIDVRIDYDWDDYDPADNPSVAWGPTIADVEVLAVRYLDDEGNEVAASAHFEELAWELANKHQEVIIEACTEHGYQHDAGRAPATYRMRSSPSKSSSTGPSEFVPRLAPSERTRTAKHDRRQLG